MAITSAQQTQLIELYVAILDRAPLSEGLNFWAQVLTDSGSLVYTANEMWNSAGAQADYPAFLTTEQIVEEVFQNVFGRAPQAEGLAFWTAEWNQFGAAQTMINMINNMNNNTSTDPQFLEDKALFLNKVEFGKWVAFESGLTDPDKAKDASEMITSDPASIAAAQEFVALDDAEVVILTSGSDFETTGNNDDIFEATEATLNTSDNLDGGDGYDELRLDINTSSAFFAAPTIDNIELITVTQGGSSALTMGTLDLSDSDIADEIILETNENEELDWTWADIQNANNALLRVIDTNEGEVNYVYDTNSYAGDDTADLTVAEVDCLTVNMFNETVDGDPSSIVNVDLHSLSNGQVNTTTANYIWDLNVGPLFTNLVVDGDADLTIESALDRSVNFVDASGLAADFDIDLYGNGARQVINQVTSLVDPITVIGAQGDDNIGVQQGNYLDNSYADIYGVNGIYDLGTGDDTLKVGYQSGPYGWDTGEDCHDQDGYLSEKSYGNSTVTTGTGEDSVYLWLHGEQTVSTGDDADYIEIMGDTDDLLTSPVGDGVSTIDSGSGADEVAIYSDYGNYDVTLGDGADTLTIEGCEVECGIGDQTVDAGNGDDSVTIHMIGDHDVVTGEGADTVTIGCDCDYDLGNQTVDTGNGDDILTITGVGIHDITLGEGDDTLLVEGAWNVTEDFDYGDDDITVVDAGDGNDDLTFVKNHWLDVDLGDDNDSLTLNASDLTSDDTVLAGEGQDTIVLYNDDTSDCALDNDECAEEWVTVNDTETKNVSSVEVFDLRNSNIELHLTEHLFDSAADNHITVITENSADKSPLPTLTYINDPETEDDDVTYQFEQGMTREDWEAIVEDVEEGLFVEIAAQGSFADAERELVEYILGTDGYAATDVDQIDMVDNNNDSDDYSADVDGENPTYDDGSKVSDDDEDQFFFLDFDTCEQLVDITEMPLNVGYEFTLLGGTIKDTVVANESSINTDVTLRFDSAGSDLDSIEDTLIVEGDATLTAADLRNVSGLECIILQDAGASQEGRSWEIYLTDNVVNQTTGNADLVIWVDSDVPDGSELRIYTDSTVDSSTNGVQVKGNGNVEIYINDIAVTNGSYDADGGANNSGIITVSQQFILTENKDTLIGGSGSDVFYAGSLQDMEDADVVDGNGGIDTLLFGFEVDIPTVSMEEQVDNNLAGFEDIEILKFTRPEAGNKEAGDIMTNKSIKMYDLGFLSGDVDEIHTGSADDFLDYMGGTINLGGASYFTYGGNDYINLIDYGTVEAGTGDDTIYGSNGSDNLDGGADNDYIVGGSGYDTIMGGTGADSIWTWGDDSVYVDGGSENDYINTGSGDDDIIGGAGSDTIYSGSGADSIEAGEGDNYVNAGTGYSDADTINAGAGNDTIFGGNGNNVINAGHGDNSVTTGTGADYITAGSGADTIISGSGSDDIFAGSGNDYINAGNSTGLANGSEYIDAGAGDDFITFDYLSDGNGTTTGDTVLGGAGSDTLSIETGAAGGNVGETDDSDFLNLSGLEALVYGNTAQDVEGAAEFEEAFGATGVATVESGTGADTLDFEDVSSATDLVIDSGAGADTILGGDGDDYLMGNTGADDLDGGAGADTLDVGVDTAADTESDQVTYGSPQDGGPSGDGLNDFVDFDTILNFDANGTGSDDLISIDGPWEAAFDTDAETTNTFNADMDDYGLFVYESNEVDFSDLQLTDVTKVLDFLNQSAFQTIEAGDEALVAIQGDSDTGLYYVVENNGDGVIDASEVTMIGIVDNALLGEAHIDI